jgi:hypothetical protein
MMITHDRCQGTLTLDQSNYLKKVSEHFEVSGKEETPLPKGFVFKNNILQVSPKFMNNYQQIVGSIMYSMIGLWPDIAFTTIKLSQHVTNPSNAHYKAALHLLRYLNKMSDYHIAFYGKWVDKTKVNIVAYSDSDWAPNNCRSITGFFVQIVNATVMWQSQCQNTVA